MVSQFCSNLSFGMAPSAPLSAQASLNEKYPPSEPCSCEICRAYCQRPGWWSVRGAQAALAAGHARRMMLEVSPDRTFAVLAPAFKGAEGYLGLQQYSRNGCTFLENGLCQLHAAGLLPLECAFCHHDRIGQGPYCHADLEKDWNTPVGQALVRFWLKSVDLWSYRDLIFKK